MGRLARFAVIIFASLASLGVSGGASSANAAVSVFMSYADWCLPCQVLTPKLESAIDEVGDDQIELIYLDFTEMTVENLDRQFDRAAPLAPEDFMDGRFIKTGFAYVLSDGVLVGEITSDMTAGEIVEVLAGALKHL